MTAHGAAPGGPVLAIDSASAEAAVAVAAADGAPLAERRWRLETNYSRELLAAVDAALREAGVARGALAAIAVDAGPGGYSGLRAGVATAQGLAFALGVPLAGVSRLEAAAFPHLGAGAPVVAVHAAGGGRLAWAAYAAVSDAAAPPATLEAPRLDEPGACLRAAPRGALWCGEIDGGLRAAVEASGGAVAGEEANARRAADLVRLAALHGAWGDPALVEAVYLRPPPITPPARAPTGA